MPKVSIVMPVYNGVRYLREALDSLLTQTFQDFEIWAIDDGSTDDSPALLASIRDPRLRVYRQDNAGQTGALNTGLKLAKGEYIARMDQDDISEPERLAMQVAFLDSHPEVGLLGSEYMWIDEKGTPLRKMSFPRNNSNLRRAMARCNPFAHSAVMFRRSLIEQVGGYIQNKNYPQFQDYELWIRMAVHSQVANLPVVLMRYRVHESSSSAGADDTIQRCNIDLRAKAIRTLHLSPWMWYYVLKSRVALSLPVPWRNRVRRLLRQPTC